MSSRLFMSSLFIRLGSRTSAGKILLQRQLHHTTLTPRIVTARMATMNGHSKGLSLDQIRSHLSQSDVNCNGKLTLELDNQTGLAVLCIDSPERKNAFSGTMMAQFSNILTQLEQWKEGRAVIIHGANEFFCSGADLKTVGRLSDKEGAYFISKLMHDNLTRFHALSLVTIGLIEGKALGGGAELITACDFRVFTPSTQIGFVHARLGVTPGFGGGVRLINLVGRARALQLMLSTRLIDVEEARQLGLVQHVLPTGLAGAEALEEARAWFMDNYGHITPFVSRQIKSIASKVGENVPLEEALEFEANIFCSVWGSEEHKQALASNIKHR